MFFFSITHILPGFYACLFFKYKIKDILKKIVQAL